MPKQEREVAVSNQGANLVIIVFGGFFFILGLVLAGRMWWMGSRWPSPDVHAKASEIERVASLRLGVSALIGGACVVGGGIFLALAPESARSGAAGGAIMVLILEALVAVVMIFRSGIKLSDRAAGVRIQDKLPKRPTLYLVWPSKQDPDNSNPN